MKIIKRALQIIIILLMVALFVRAVLFIFDTDNTVAGDNPIKGEDYVAVLDFSGMIISVDDIILKLEELEASPNVKGYLLRVNSPGGLVTPSQQLYEYLSSLSKPLYVAMGSSAASGGYMVSLPAEKIYAMPSTITGSIGVIMQMPNYEALMEKVGVSTVVIKSGKFKDAGSPSRAMTDGERLYLEGIVMDMYAQFVDVVSKDRNLDIDTATALADGSVYTGRMAKDNGLIDELGSWMDALQALKIALGDENMADYNIEYRYKSNMERLFSKIENFEIRTPIDAATMPAGFYYMGEY